MKIISCHVENFGILSNFDIEFNDGLNVILEDNGYGKSTLSAFLRIMFYGFDNESRRDEQLNERLKYRPWQGGTYGGSLTIWVNDKEYIINRIFGNKESEDVFEIRNADTLLVSEDYSTNIGEQIFGLDSESFKKSVMLSQNDCETRATDGINAKLGNLTETTDDINNFESVDEQFKKLLNGMSDTKKTGSRYKLKSDIYRIEHELRNKDRLIKDLADNQKLLSAEKSANKSFKEQIALLEAKKNSDTVNRGLYLAKEQYLKTVRMKEDLEEQLPSDPAEIILLQAVFGNGTPDDEQLELVNEKINRLKAYKEKKAADDFSFSELNDFNRLDAIFKDKNDPINELDEALFLLEDSEEKERRISILNDQMAAYPGQDDSDRYREDRDARNKKIFGIAGLIIGILVMISSAVLYSNRALAESVLFLICIIGVILSVISVVCIISANNKRRERKRVNNELDKLNATVNELRKACNHNHNVLNRILTSYRIDIDKYDTGRKICRMRDDYEYYCRLASRTNGDAETSYRVKIANISAELDKYFEPFNCIIGEGDYLERLYSLRAKRQYYELLSAKLENIQKLNDEISAFEARDDFGEIYNSYKPEQEKDNNKEMANTEIDWLIARVEASDGICRDYVKRIEQLEEEIDALDELEIQATELREELDEQNENSRIAELTRHYLNEAKTSFVKRYSAPVTNNFRKYYQVLDGNNSANYSFDANTNLGVYAGGKIRKPEALSRGMRDLAGIAFRMALTEAMFKSEKPYLIMDDPFVNLDDGRLGGAMQLINNISDEYQVIYFTCSSSRNPS